MTPTRPARPVGDRIRGLAAALALAAAAVGIPALLLAIAGNPLPTTLPTLDAFTRPDEDGRLFLTALLWLAWLAWAWFAIPILVELAAQLRHRPAPRLPGMGMSQRTAGALVASAALLFTTPLPATTGHAHATTTGPTHATAVSAPATVSAPPTAADDQDDDRPVYVVQPPRDGRHDNLWDIAERHLGDGQRYREIFTLNKGRPQPDGDQLRRPELIRPGWQLTMPADAVGLPKRTPAKPVSRPSSPPPQSRPGVELPDTPGEAGDQTAGDQTRHVPPAAATPAPTARPAAPPAPGAQLTSPAPTPATAPEDSDQLDDIDEPPAALRTAGGVGALLAAGILALLGAKRARQQRRRRPGQRIPMPPADLATDELELRVVEDPDGLTRVDRALRTLAAHLHTAGQPLPRLRAARLTGQRLELYLAEPTDLPAPFTGTADHAVWAVDGDAPLLSSGDAANVPAPYPSLVTIGLDLEQAHLLLDLEEVAALTIDGPPDQALAILRAIAVELATSIWADDLQITTVGCCPELAAALGTGRARYVDDLDRLLTMLEGRARSVRAALDRAGAPNLHDARSRQLMGDAWTPEIVLLAEPVPDDMRTRLEVVLHELPRVGIAAVTATGPRLGDWTLRADPRDPALAHLEPVGVTIEPQRLGDPDYGRILEILTIAATSGAPAGAAAEPTLEELPVPRMVEQAAEQLLQMTDPPGPHTPSQSALDDDAPPDVDLTSTTAPAAIDLTTPPSGTGAADDGGVAPESSATAAAPDGPVVVARDDDAHGDAAADATRPPLIRVLGEIDVVDVPGIVTTDSDKMPRLTEFAVFLALHPTRGPQQINDLLLPNSADPKKAKATRNGYMSRLRRWFGQDANGDWYIPIVNDAEGGYRLNPTVRTDWRTFCDLVGTSTTPEDLAHVPTDRLAAALELVRGQPFASAVPPRYVWAEGDKADMISAIVDVAHEAASRALRAGDAAAARRAVTIGQKAEPGSEVLWRDKLRAEWIAGSRPGLENTVQQIAAQADDLGTDLEPETEQLIRELLNA